MRLIPTYCESCRRSALVGTNTIVGGVAVCPDCGASSRTLPGESYAPECAKLYKSLETALHEAELSPPNAAQLAVELEGRNRTPGRGLKRIAQLVPSLSLSELLVSNEPIVMRRVEGMLATLLDAMATSRSTSSAPAPAELRGGKADGGLL
jgi:hypothetical protein